MKRTAAEERRLTEVADEYRAKGYHVVLAPGPAQTPDWLMGYEADLLALSADDKVVVEIKSPNRLRFNRELAALARVVESHSDWRLELVVSGSPPRRIASGRGTVLPRGYATEHLDAARELTERGAWLPAFIVAWTAFEIAFRNTFDSAGIDPHTSETQTVLKTLLSLGILSGADELQRLAKVWDLRNYAVHGYAPEFAQFAGDYTDFIVDVTHRLLSADFEAESERKP
jgi:hypothetical protein